MKVKILTTNSKLGFQIPSVNLAPQCSCRADAPCAHGCYGKKGNFTYKNVQNSIMSNALFYKEDPRGFFDEITSFLNNSLVTYKYFRWHSVGDIVDAPYFDGMVEVARKCKGVRFLCFTKKFDIVNGYVANGGKIPSNLKIVFSAWSKAFKVDNPYRFPVAYVFFRKAEMNPKIPETAIPCGGSCPECLACWTLRKGQSVYFKFH